MIFLGMKLNDIYTSLETDIDLKKESRETIPSPLENLTINNTDRLGDELKDLNIKSNQKINPGKLKTKTFDSAVKKGIVKKNLNLKSKIKKSGPLLARIANFKIHLFIYNLKKLKLPKLPKQPKNFPKKVFQKSNNYKYTFSIIGIVLLLVLDFLFSLLFLNLGIDNLKTINLKQSEKIEEKLSYSDTMFELSKTLYTPFSFIKIDSLQNIDKAINIVQISNNTLKITNSIYSGTTDKSSFYEVSEILEKEEDSIKKIENNIKKINVLLGEIKLDNNSKYFPKLQKAKQVSYLSQDILTSINNNFDSFLNLIGNESKRDYFIVFQNNDEIRATGGFMGSAGVISIFKGKLVDINQKDIYAFEWDINKAYKDKITPPKGIDRITTSFGLRDSNYFADFRKSANSINFFLQKGGYEVDGVVFINMNSVTKIIDLVGPIKLDGVITPITGDNFAEVMSILVEAKVSKKGTLGTPKQVLFNFQEVLKEKVINSGKIPEVINIIKEEINNREIVFNSFEKSENDILKAFGVTGEINYKDTVDFTYPVYTSIGGNKTDRYTEISYHKDIRSLPNCDINTNLRIDIKHSFDDNKRNRVLDLMNQNGVGFNQDLINIQGNGINKSFVRVLLPKQAIVTKSEGQTVKDMQDFSYVDFFTETNPNSTSTYNINYILPNRECRKYKFKLYKQPGIRSYNININKDNSINNFSNIRQDFMFE